MAFTPLPAAAAGTGHSAAVEAALAQPAARGMQVRPPDGRVLGGSRAEFVTGHRVEAGGCALPTPDMKLGLGQSAVEARQVGIDYATCTSLWEVGTPSDVKDAVSPGASGSTQTAQPSRTGPAAPKASGGGKSTQSWSGSGYFKAWQTDVINLTVNSVKSNISWSWNYGCTESGSGSVNYTWTSASGWEPPYNNGVWISRVCDYAVVWAQADYRNTGFCWPNTVYSRYRDIAVAGWFDGGFAGSAGENRHWGNDWCAPLWDNQQLVRVT
jgi:hypothetical protein